MNILLRGPLWGFALSVTLASLPSVARAELLNDTWAYYVDTQTWVELTPAGEPRAPAHGIPAQYDPVKHRMMMLPSKQLNLVQGAEEWAPLEKPEELYVPWYYEHNSAKRQTLFSPTNNGMLWWNLADDSCGTGTMTSWAWTGRIGSFAVDDERDRLVDFGRSRLIEYKLDENNNAVAMELPLQGDVPVTYDFHKAVVDTTRDRMIIFGGNAGTHAVYPHYEDDTFELNLATDTWELVQTSLSPSPRGQYGCVWDEQERRMYIVCGLYRTSFDFSTVSTYNDVWMYDSATQTWREEITNGPTPPHRRQPSAIFDPINRRIIMWGGERLNPPPPSRSILKLPRNGRKIGGNSVTVMAELSNGKPETTASVTFQYRLPSITGEWQPIPPSGVDETNPDTTHPYFIHWDVTGLQEGPVDLRATATSDGGIVDPAAEFITVYISHDDAITTETILASGHVSLSYTGGEGYGEVGSADVVANTNVRVRYDSATLGDGEMVHITFGDAEEFEAFTIAKDNHVVSVTTETGELAKPLTLVFNYTDTDNNGVLDGTAVQESLLTIFGKDADGDFFRLQNIQIDTEANQVRGDTSSLGHFILAGDELPTVTPEMLRDYLLGVQQPNPLEALSGDRNSDTVLDAADLTKMGQQ